MERRGQVLDVIRPTAVRNSILSVCLINKGKKAVRMQQADRILKGLPRMSIAKNTQITSERTPNPNPLKTPSF